MSEVSFAFIEALSAHPNRRALEGMVRAAAIDATLARRADFASRHRLGAVPTTGPAHIPEGLTRVDAETPFGNVLDVLERGVERPEERAMLGALLVLSLQSDPPPDAESAAMVGFHLVWLASNTPCDALGVLDAGLGADALPIWRGVARVVTSPETTPADFGPTEALVAAAALRRSWSAEAQELRFDALALVNDEALYALLAPTPGDFSDALMGEVQPVPRGPVLTALLSITLVLFVWSAARLIGRYAFLYKRPAALRLGPQGLELSYRVELMGQVLRDRVVVVPLSNLARVTREVKYARLGLYAGLAALTLGTYFGTGLFVDGVRVPGGSAPLLGLAALFIVVGLGADFVLNSGADAARGRCRLVIAQRKGPSLCIGALDPARADALLHAVAEQTRSVEPEPASPNGAAPTEPSAPGTDPARQDSVEPNGVSDTSIAARDSGEAAHPKEAAREPSNATRLEEAAHPKEAAQEPSKAAPEAPG